MPRLRRPTGEEENGNDPRHAQAETKRHAEKEVRLTRWWRSALAMLSSRSGSKEAAADAARSARSRRGVILLVLTNVLWIVSSEITRYLFVDQNFKRPFFVVIVKNCLLTFYFGVHIVQQRRERSPAQKPAAYSKLSVDTDDRETDEESSSYVPRTLSPLGFESVSWSDSEVMEEEEEGAADDDNTEISSSSRSKTENGKDQSPKGRKRSVTFSKKREVRRLPSAEAEDARRARLSIDSSALADLFCNMSVEWRYILFFFAPLWLICSCTYQAALLYASVSAVNLLSSSSSLFLLILSSMGPSHDASSRFSVAKLVLVVLNILGVAIVSQVSDSLWGSALSLLSAFAYALYLYGLSVYKARGYAFDVPLTFGVMGIMSFVLGVPLLCWLHVLGVERLHPWPDRDQWASILGGSVVGTLIADVLWLIAARWTSSLTASLSLSLSIPFALIGDTLFRARRPSGMQLFATVPILVSFLGATYLEAAVHTKNGGSSATSSSNAVVHVHEPRSSSIVNPMQRGGQRSTANEQDEVALLNSQENSHDEDEL